MPGFKHIPYGDLEVVKGATGKQTAAVMVEPIMGEGGVIVPPAGYLRAAAALCQRHNAFLVLDEVQTGLGRLGSWWGADQIGRASCRERV